MKEFMKKNSSARLFTRSAPGAELKSRMRKRRSVCRNLLRWKCESEIETIVQKGFSCCWQILLKLSVLRCYCKMLLQLDRVISGGWIRNRVRYHWIHQQFWESFCTNAELSSQTWNLIFLKKSVLQLLRAWWFHVRWALNRLWPPTTPRGG